MRKLVLILSAAFFLSVVGCGNSGNQMPMVSVQGTVTLDGKPMPEGDVVFRAPDPTHPPRVFKVTNGSYSGKATLGKRKVEVMAYKEEPPPKSATTKEPIKKNYLPDRFNTKTTFEVDVTESGPNTFDFKVESK